MYFLLFVKGRQLNFLLKDYSSIIVLYSIVWNAAKCRIKSATFVRVKVVWGVCVREEKSQRAGVHGGVVSAAGFLIVMQLWGLTTAPETARVLFRVAEWERKEMTKTSCSSKETPPSPPPPPPTFFPLFFDFGSITFNAVGFIFRLVRGLLRDTEHSLNLIDLFSSATLPVSIHIIFTDRQTHNHSQTDTHTDTHTHTYMHTHTPLTLLPLFSLLSETWRKTGVAETWCPWPGILLFHTGFDCYGWHRMCNTTHHDDESPKRGVMK